MPTATENAEPDVPMPSAAQRSRTSVFIVAFLLVQILIPLSYYVRQEPTSERYSWRMFSSIDLSTWDTSISAVVESNGKLVEREIPLATSLQESYVKTLERAQFDIVEPFMRRVASQPGVREVRFTADGKLPSGKLMSPIRISLKPDGELVRLSN